MSMVELIKKAHGLVSREKRAFQPMPGGQMPPMMAGGGMPMDPSMMGGGGMPMDPSMMGGGGMPPMDPSMMGGGGMPMDPSMMGGGGMPPVDPATGMPIDPATGMIIDPNTGMPIDPNTGMPMDPSMMGGAPMGDPAAEDAAMEEQLRAMIREEVQAVLDGQAPPSDKKPEEGNNSEISQKLDMVLKALGLGDEAMAGTAAPQPDPMIAPPPTPGADPAAAMAAEPQMEKMQSARKPKTIAQVIMQGARRAAGGQ